MLVGRPVHGHRSSAGDSASSTMIGRCGTRTSCPGRPPTDVRDAGPFTELTDVGTCQSWVKSQGRACTNEESSGYCKCAASYRGRF